MSRLPPLAALLLFLLLVLVTSEALATATRREGAVLVEHIRVAGLPEELDGLRVGFVTDVHAGPWLRREDVGVLVSRMNAAGPDVLLLGGDNVGGEGFLADGASEFYPAARGFRARYGKYAVLGNHDWREGDARARRGLAGAGFQVIDGLTVSPVPGLAVTGLGDFEAGSPDYGTALAQVPSSGTSLLLTHNPDAIVPLLEGLRRSPWALALAGHLHGGQVTLGGWAPVVPSVHGARFLGRSDYAGMPVIDSNGYGATMLPLRLGAEPEAHLFILHPARD